VALTRFCISRRRRRAPREYGATGVVAFDRERNDPRFLLYSHGMCVREEAIVGPCAYSESIIVAKENRISSVKSIHRVLNVSKYPRPLSLAKAGLRASIIPVWSRHSSVLSRNSKLTTTNCTPRTTMKPRKSKPWRNGNPSQLQPPEIITRGQCGSSVLM
jgi:hypothetical protein